MGIADSGEFYILPPGTAALAFNKVKYQELKLCFIRQAPNHSRITLLIVPMSSPTIGNTNISGSFMSQFSKI